MFLFWLSPCGGIVSCHFVEIHIKMTALERNKRTEVMITLSNTILGDLKK